MSKHDFTPVIVRLTCTISYKGFHANIIAKLDQSKNTIVYGEDQTEDKIFKVDDDLNPALKEIGKMLNIKQHTHKIKNLSSPSQEIYLSVGLNAIKRQRQSLENLLATIDSEIKTQVKKLNLNKEGNLLDFGDDNDNSVYYLMKTACIFPIERRLRNIKYHMYRFRPEFMKMYDQELNPDTHEAKNMSKKIENLVLDAGDASKYFKNQVLPNLQKTLDKMVSVPMDSHCITRIFHSNGVNMRFLGEICKITKLPHIKELCISEMIARSAKRIVNHKTAQFILVARQSVDEVEERPYMKITQNKRELIDMVDRDLKKIIVKVLNLIFGRSEASIDFWRTVLKSQVQLDFSFELDPDMVTVKDLPAGYLLNACEYHMNIELVEKEFKRLGQETRPISNEDIVRFDMKCKTFDLSAHRMRLITEAYDKYLSQKKYVTALKLLQMKMFIEESLGRKYHYIEALCEIADIYLEIKSFKKCLEYCSKGLKLLNIFAPTTLKFMIIRLKSFILMKNDEKVLQISQLARFIIKYNFGNYHPLHATIDSFLASYHFYSEKYQKALIHYKSALDCCLNILGVDHSMTGQLYLDIADIFMKMSKREESIRLLEKAFQIFDTAKKEESTDKAILANKIALILFNVGSFEEAMSFASKSNEIFKSSLESEYLESVLRNSVIICMCNEKLDNDTEALNCCEETYDLATQPGNWIPAYGEFLIDLLKVTFKVRVSFEIQSVFRQFC